MPLRTSSAPRSLRTRALFAFGFVAATSSLAVAQTVSQPAAAKVELARDYGKLPLSFEANQGQAGKSVKFLSRGQGYSLFLTDSAAVLSLSKPQATKKPCHPEQSEESAVPSGTPIPNHSGCDTAQSKTDVVRMELAGGSKSIGVSGNDPLPGKANYFLGNDPTQWHSNVPTYAKVKYTSVYPGIDLVYYGNQRQLEYDFIVAPYANPNSIQLHFAGTDKLKLAPSGDLRVIARNGEIAFHKPAIYQTLNGVRRDVKGQFNVTTGNTVGFELGNYDRAAPLVIDPTLVYSTYLGGSIEEDAHAIAVDASGNAYVAGTSVSSDFPVTKGAFQTNDDKSSETYTAFVAKLNASGTALVYATYLGGSTADSANAIAVDSSGNAYIAGQTESSDFPTTDGSFQTTNPDGGGPYTGFVSKLNPSGTELLYSTYLGGSNPIGAASAEIASAIAIDSHGNAYVTGTTASSDFPVTQGAYQTSISNFDGAAFVAVFNPTGTGLVYATFLGGSPGGSAGNAIALDNKGDAYVAGTTGSANFPITAGALQTASPGFASFVTELNATGTGLIYSTFLGGESSASSSDSANAIAVDGSGGAYVAGQTYSSTFPVTSGAFQTSNQGRSDLGTGFVVHLNPSGSSLLYGTYLGGNYGTTALGLRLDSAGNAYIAGNTSSTNFPLTSNASQDSNPTNSSFGTAFLTELNPSGTQLVYSTYFGGKGGDRANAIALDASSNVYLAGATASTNFPVTAGAFQTTNHSTYGGTAFVSKLNLVASATTIASTTTITSTPNPQVVGGTVTFKVKVTPATGTGIPTGSITSTIDGVAGPTATLSNGSATFASSTLSAGSHTIVATYAGDANYTGSSATLTQSITTPPTVATPIFSPAAGTYTTTQSVTITDSTSGAAIYYTTDGTTPTTASMKYTAAISVAKTETIKAIATATGYTNSAVASATYTITTTSGTATPVISPAPGTYTSAQTVTITDATAGATIHYTTNGSTPISASTTYTAPITVSASETISAIAISSTGVKSSVATAAYVIAKPVAPVFKPAAGTYSSAQSVTITEATAGTTIHYTTNGSTPISGSPTYTGPITVSASETISAIAISSAGIKSPVATAAYVISKPVVPVIKPAAGTYSTAQSVTITEATAGTTIHYTTNGSTPVSSSPSYTGPITVSASETISAIAINAGGVKSPVATAAYIIAKPVAPVFTPAAGTYTSAQSVTITEATPGTTIHYTTNGSTPISASPTYTGPITVSASETINAIAISAAGVKSPIATAAYVISKP